MCFKTELTTLKENLNFYNKSRDNVYKYLIKMVDGKNEKEDTCKKLGKEIDQEKVEVQALKEPSNQGFLIKRK